MVASLSNTCEPAQNRPSMLAHAQVWGRISSLRDLPPNTSARTKHVMRVPQAYATVMNRGGRRPSLGRNEDRLMGGFQASMLPSHSSASSGVSQSNGFGGNQATNSGSGTSSSNSTVIIQQLGEPSEVDSGETGSAIGSVRVYCRGIQEHVKRVEQRVVAMEKKQDKMSDTLKDILDLLKKLRKESFSIKGSSYEVCNTSKKMCLKLNFVSTGCPKSRSSKAFLFISDKRPSSI